MTDNIQNIPTGSTQEPEQSDFKFPNDVKEKILMRATEMKREGYTPDQVTYYIEKSKEAYKKKAKEENIQPEPEKLVVEEETPESTLPENYTEPEWFYESGLSYSDEKNRRSEVRNIYQQEVFTPGIKRPAKLINYSSEDILTPEMVTDIDTYAQSYDPNVESIKDFQNRMRSEMNDKYNSNKSKYTRRNIDLLVEHAFSPIVQEQMAKDLSKNGNGDVNYYKLLTADPQLISEYKRSLRDKGWSGDIVDTAWNGFIGNHSDEVILQQSIKGKRKLIDEAVSEGNVSRAEAAERLVEVDKRRFKATIEERSNQKDRERQKLVDELLEAEQGLSELSDQERAQKEKRIAQIEEELDMDMRFDLVSTVVKALKSGATRTPFTLDFDYVSGLYDSKGRMLKRKGMPEETVEREKAISKIITENENNETFLDNLGDNAFNAYMVWQQLVSEKELVDDYFKSRPQYAKMNPAMIEQTGDEEAASMKRKMQHLNTITSQAEIKMEAYGRMYYQNQNIALAERDEGYYLKDAGKYLLTLNGLDKGDVRSSDAELMGVMRDVYSELNVPMTEEELKNTAPDVKLEISRGATGMADLVAKTFLFDKMVLGGGKIKGAVGLIDDVLVNAKKLRLSRELDDVLMAYKGARNSKAKPQIVKAITAVKSGKYTKAEAQIAQDAVIMTRGEKLIGQASPLFEGGGKAFKSKAFNNVASNLMHAGYEGVKFQFAGGDFETGALFYESQTVLGGLGKGWKSPVMRSIGAVLQATGGMTASMELVASAESAIDAALEDRDVVRAIKEDFGTWDEAKQRIFVEMASAAPFGMKAVVRAAKSGTYKMKAKDMYDISLKMRRDGTIENAGQKAEIFEMLAVELGLPEHKRKAIITKNKAEILAKETDLNVRKMNNKQVEKEYSKYLEENQISDPLAKTFGDAAEGKYDPIHMRDIAELHGEIQTLRNEGVKMAGKTKAEIKVDYEKIRLNKNAVEKGTEPSMSFAERMSFLYGENNPLEMGKEINRVGAEEAAIKSERARVKAEKKLADGKGWEGQKTAVKDNLVKAVNDIYKRVGGERFEDAINRYSGKTYKEFIELINSDSKTKGELLEKIDIVEDIIHKVDIENRPKVDYIGLISNKSKANPVRTTEYEQFRNSVMSHKHGAKEAVKGYVEQMNTYLDQVNSRLGDIWKSDKKIFENAGITFTQIKNLIKPVKPSADLKEVKKKLEQVEQIVSRWELNNSREKISKDLKKYKPKAAASQQAKGTLDAISTSKVEVADILFNKNSKAAGDAIVRITEKRKNAKNQYEKDLYDAQLDALKTVGEREVALERMAELAVKQGNEGLTQKELLEYEMLEFNDGKRMTRNDMLAAEASMKQIIATGRSLTESINQSREIMKSVEIEAALEMLGLDITKATELERESDLGRALDFDNRKLIVKYLTDHRLHTESFVSMMNMISKYSPHRVAGEGIFESMGQDFQKAREHKDSEVGRITTDATIEAMKIFKAESTEALESIRKRNRKETNDLTVTTNGNSKTYKGMTVDKVAKLWQYTLDPNHAKNFEYMGWGVENGKFDMKKLQGQLENYIIENGGKESLDWYRWQVEEFYPKMYNIINPIYRKINGTDLGNSVNYSPSFVKGALEGIDGKKLEWKDLNDIMSSEANYFIMNAGNGNLKQRTEGAKSFKLDIGADATMDAYTRKMMHYKHFQEPLTRAREIFNDPRVGAALSDKFSKGIVPVIKKALSDIGTDVHGGRKFPVLDKIRQQAVRATIGVNVGVFLKQLTSVPAYRAGLRQGEVSAYNEFMAKSSRFDSVKNQWRREFMESQFIQNRLAKTGFDINVADLEANRDLISSQPKGKWLTGNIATDQMVLGRIGDIKAIVQGAVPFWYARTQSYIKQGMTPEAAKKKAYTDTVHQTKATQQSAGMEDTSSIQREGSLGRTMTMYGNTPQQYYRLFRAGIDRFNQGRRDLKIAETPEQIATAKWNRRKGARDFAIFGYVLPVLFRMAQQSFYIKDNPLDDEGLTQTLLLGGFTNAWLVGDMAEDVLSTLLTDHSFGADILPIPEAIMESITEMASEIQKILKDGIEPDDIFDSIMTIGEPFAYMAGFPMAAPKLVKGVADFITGKTDDPRALIGASKASRGYYDRSWDWDEINESIEAGESMNDFLKKMKKRHPETYSRSSARWRKEYKIYSHFGGHNPDVNQLYSGRMTNEEKAKYLYRLKYGIALPQPTMGSALRKVSTTEEDIDKFVHELRYMKVISPEVVKMLYLLEKEKGKK